jgi:hypothetical protein
VRDRRDRHRQGPVGVAKYVGVEAGAFVGRLDDIDDAVVVDVQALVPGRRLRQLRGHGHHFVELDVFIVLDGEPELEGLSAFRADDAAHYVLSHRGLLPEMWSSINRRM